MIYAGAYHGKWKDESDHGGRNVRVGGTTADELDFTSILCLLSP
jgi:hypothetical protein